MLSKKTGNYLAALALALMGIALARQEWLVFQREARLKSGGAL